MTAACVSPAAIVGDPSFPRVRSLLIESTGLSYYLDQQLELAARISLRMAARGLTQVHDYLECLTGPDEDEAEWNALVSELTIGETYFFRHQEQFDALRDVVLPDIVERNRQHRTLRIWSAGCANGAELYSVAILLKRELADLVGGWGLTLIGTDVNRDCLASAERGEYADWSLRSMSAELKHACFNRTDGTWLLKPEYRHGVSFKHHNLVKHPFPSPHDAVSAFDLILCRNVMIYFDRTLADRLIRKFHASLTDGGWFLVGHAEANVEQFREFRTANAPGTVLYQKPPVAVPADAADDRCGPAELISTDSTRRGRNERRSGAVPQTRQMPSSKASAVNPAPRAEVQPSTVAEQLADIRDRAHQSRWDEAAAACRQLIAFASLNPTAHFHYAWVLEHLGEQAEAESALRRAIYLDRKFVLAHFHLGVLLQRRGEIAPAILSFRSTARLLAAMDDNDVLPDTDGLTAGSLKQWAQSHLETLSGT